MPSKDIAEDVKSSITTASAAHVRLFDASFDSAETEKSSTIENPPKIASGGDLLEGWVLPDQSNHSEGAKIFHPQHAGPSPHSHHISGRSRLRFGGNAYEYF